MARRPRSASPAAGAQGAGARAADHPFAGLRSLLREADDAARQPSPAADDSARKSSPQSTPHSTPESAPASARQTPSTAAPGPGAPAAIDEADLALFRKTVGAARPLRDAQRAEIERPRPAPLPRPQPAAEEDGAAPPAARIADPLRAAYEDVIPLRDTGRVELDTAVRHAARQRADAKAPAAPRPTAMVLPAGADQADPSALFRQVVGDARPIDSRNRVELERPPPPPAPVKREADERAALDESLATPLTFEDRLDMGDEAAFLRPGLPRRVLSDLRRGRWVLQGQIDLHGLTRDEARAALAQFLHTSLAQGRRCIRVIHGKGLGSPGKVSILKQLSRGWLAQREEILAFCQAGPHDGGGGALLVLMRAQNSARD